jgi:hypothetical protein
MVGNQFICVTMLVFYQMVSFGDLKRISLIVLLQAILVLFMLYFISIDNVEAEQTKFITLLVVLFLTSVAVIVRFISQGGQSLDVLHHVNIWQES